MPKPEIEFTAFESVPHTPCDPHIEGLTEQVLARNDEDGTVTRVLTFQPGTDTSPNGTLAHDCWEEVFIFEGSFVDMRLGTEFKAGDFATRPPGMLHGPWRSENGARMFEVRYNQPPKGVEG
ncbi:MAG: cupin domain-containing protein [Actinobacteria bacterium]|nr:cupin domain-containing protein [Actinomycetota bacterium]